MGSTTVAPLSPNAWLRTYTAPMDSPSDAAVATLAQVVLPERAARLEEVLAMRPRHLVLVLENLFDAHNLCAVFRTADAYGIQEVHVLDRTGDFGVSRKITMGAHKWLDLHVGDSPEALIGGLQERGYRVFAATLAEAARPTPLPDLDLSGRVAFVFGNEHRGLEDDTVALCDGAFVIPMRGFAQSLNVSVSAAVTLHHARATRDWPALEDDDAQAVRRHWTVLAVKQAERIVTAVDG